MARKIIWTKNAKDDLKEIVEYLQQRWSNKVAENFVIECYSRIYLIAQFPQIGVASEKNKSIRRVLITKHNALYYLVEEDKITLLDFFDTRQNPTKNPY